MSIANATIEKERARRSSGIYVNAGVLATIVGVAALVATRDLHTYANFDEGNYLGSLDALRHGQSLGRDVFLDQPPGWYLLLLGVSYVFGNSMVGVRTGLLVVALVAVVAAYVCGRLVGGPVAGLVAAAVMSVARPFPQWAGLVESEPAAAALATAAIALGLYAYRQRFRPWPAFAAGAALAAATAVKLPGATAAAPLAFLAVTCRSGPIARRLLMPLAGAAAVVGALIVGYHNVLPQIWHGVFVTHANASNFQTPQSNLHRALAFVDPRIPFGLLVIAGAAASVVLAVRGVCRTVLGALWLWAATGYAFILLMHPLSDHHFVFLAVPLALPAGVALGLLVAELRSGYAVAASTVCIAALFAVGAAKNWNEITRTTSTTPPSIAWAVAQIRDRTTQRDVVVSDIPIIPYLARRRMPGQLIDTSIARIALQDLPQADVLRIIDETHPAAVVAGRMFVIMPKIMAGLVRRYPLQLQRPLDGGYVTIYLPRR